jgi:hypothetical protein
MDQHCASVEQQLKALSFFKDWSNLLLATTTIAMGWLARDQAGIKPGSVWCFAGSIKSPRVLALGA